MKLINKIMKTKAIHKLILPMKEESTIRLPYGANIIKGENQDGFVAIWAIVDLQAPLVDRHFKLLKTGQNFECSDVSKLRFIGRADIHVGMDLGMYIFELLP